MVVINALLLCGAVLAFMLLLSWEMLTQPRFLRSVLVWTAVLGGVTFVALIVSGAGFFESLIGFVVLLILIATTQLRYRIPELMWRRQQAHDARYDAWGNPRPTDESPKVDGPPGV